MSNAPSNQSTLPYHVRITGPGMDWSMLVGDVDDIEVIIKVIEKMTRLIMNSAPSAAAPSKRHLPDEGVLAAAEGAVPVAEHETFSNDPRPRYQCPVEGCPANHESKWQVCSVPETGLKP